MQISYYTRGTKSIQNIWVSIKMPHIKIPIRASIKKKVHKDNWIQKAGQIKIDKHNRSTAPNINVFLNRLRSDIQKWIADYENEYTRVPSLEELESMLSNKVAHVSGKAVNKRSIYNLYTYLDYYCDNVIPNMQRRSENSKYQLKIHVRVIGRFLETTGRTNASFSSVDIKFLGAYMMFLCSPQWHIPTGNNNRKEPYIKKDGYSSKYIRGLFFTFQAIMQNAFDENYSTNTIMISKKFDYKNYIKLIKPESMHLTLDEVSMLENHLFENKLKNEIRDLFLISVYTGCSYSDLHKITPERIVIDEGKEFIQYYRQKSQVLCNIPVMPKIKAIWRKYEGKIPQIREPKESNEIIKVICFEAGITGKRTIKVEEKRRSVIKPVSIAENITWHNARHTFVTLMAEAGALDSDIIAATGHKDTAMLKDVYNRIKTIKKAHRLAANSPF